MDMIRIGKFLAELRKEQGWTQMQLGEQLGITGKTISRWETGTYLPPAEMLLLLSELYGISINEILSGSRLTQEEYSQRAEENLKTVLRESPFTQKERADFFKRKYRKEHRFEMILAAAVTVVLMLLGVFCINGLELAAMVFGFCCLMRYQNRKAAYVESRMYPDPQSQNNKI